MDQLALGGAQGQRGDVAVDRPQLGPRAVGAGAQRPAQGLLVDVGQVGHGPAMGRQRGTERTQPRARLDDRLVALPAGDAAHDVQGHQGSGCDRQRGEGVPCPNHAYGRGPGLDHIGQRRLIGGRGAPGGIGVLDARPVPPQRMALGIRGGRRGRLGLIARRHGDDAGSGAHHGHTPGARDQRRPARNPPGHYWAPSCADRNLTRAV